MNQLFRRKSIVDLIRDSENAPHKLAKTLGLWSLVALGIGMVIGSGIFTLPGTAAAGVTTKYPSILHAPVLDLLRYGTDALTTSGRPGAGPAVGPRARAARAGATTEVRGRAGETPARAARTGVTMAAWAGATMAARGRDAVAADAAARDLRARVGVVIDAP